MTRRRMLLEQDDGIIFTFQDLVDALVSFGNGTGTDENGFYVESNGQKNNSKLITDNFKANTQYEIGIYAYNTYAPTGYIAANMRLRYVIGQYMNFPSGTTKNTFLTDARYTVDFIEGIWYGGTAKIYDFYIKEV